MGVACGVAIGSTGVGAVACGALAGAVGSLVTGAMQGHTGWDLVTDSVVGGVVGGITGGLASAVSAGISSAIRGVVTGGVRNIAGNFFCGAGAEIRNIAGGLDDAAGAVRNLFRPSGGARDAAAGSPRRPRRRGTWPTPGPIGDCCPRPVAMAAPPPTRTTVRAYRRAAPMEPGRRRSVTTTRVG